MVQIYLGILSPVMAVVFGILILIFPRILNYLVAAYLIAMGIFGLIAAI